ncbi:MAG: DUF533 domain-containing protein, partial [Pseudomonadota bacterium]
MFNARNLIEQMMRGAAPQSSGSGQSAGGLEDLLRNLTGGQSGSGASGQSGGFNLEDLVRNLSQGQQSGAQAQRPGIGVDSGAQSGGSTDTSGGLSDLLGQLQNQFGGSQGDASGQSGGGLMDQLGDTFRQATDGARDGADKIGQSTGLNDIISQISGGKSGGELLGQLQELINNNKLGAGAALGGLGALVLGTQTGRSVAVNAAKVGALALIGGLAYKAYQNYSNGQSASDIRNIEPEPAPEGTGFEESAVSDQMAVVVLRAMMAAAAADGRLDAQEQERITANLVDNGLDREAEEFIAREMNSPASPADLAAGVRDQREALQVYTAARIAIDPDTHAEADFLA